jgi:hypothetical protein
LRDRVER